MTYTTDAVILSKGTTSAEAIQAWLESRGRAAAPRYGKDGQYTPVPTTLGASIVSLCNRAGWAQVNHDIVAAQIDEETAGWQSEYARERNNPGGIGAEDDNPDEAYHFPTPHDGIEAHVAHLLTYAAGEGWWNGIDPRFELTPKAWQGTTTTIGRLAGRWATQPKYGEYIRDRANLLLDFANNGTWEPPMAGDDDRFEWKPDVSEFGYPQGAHGRAGYSIDLGIIHYTQGTNSSGWLRGNNGSSTHYLTKLDMTPFEQHVREADAAWTAGNREYNLRGINVEGELPGDQWTHDLIREFAKTTLPIWKRNNIPLVYLGKDNGVGKRGLIGHADVPNQDHTDPGKTFDWPLYTAELRRLDGSTPPADDWPKVPTTERDPWRQSNPYRKDLWVPGVFVDKIMGDGFMNSGYALAPAFAEAGDDGALRVVMYFERCRWELSQDGTITKGLVGRESFNARYPGGAP